MHWYEDANMQSGVHCDVNIRERCKGGKVGVVLVIPEKPVEDALNSDFLHDCRYLGCDKQRQ